MTPHRPRLRRGKGNPTSMADILASRGDILAGTDIWKHWDRVVGPIVSRHAQPLSYRDGVLWVSVATAPWIQELQYQAETIRAGLNSACGVSLVRELRFRQGRLPAPRSASPAIKKEAASLPPLPPPEPEVRHTMDQALGRLADPEMRKSMERLWILAHHRARRNRATRNPSRHGSSREEITGEHPDGTSPPVRR